MSQLVIELAGAIPRNGRCLEIGIGTGRIALPLTRVGVPIIGIDISSAMLRRLVSNAAGNHPPIIVADATRLPFVGRSFASAIAAHVFHLIPGWKQAVGELVRVLRPGGILLASRGGRSVDGWERQVRSHFFVEAGNPPWPPGADRIEDLDAHLHSLGAAVRVLTEVSVEGSSTINAQLASLEAGHQSACWSIDEPTRKTAAAATRQWAATEIGDVDEPRPSRESSLWHAYVTPT